MSEDMKGLFTCKNCKYKEPQNGLQEFTICNKITHYERANSKKAKTGDAEGYDSYLEVKDNFGCNEWVIR